VTQLLPLIAAIPAIRGQRGRPTHRPHRVQGDRGYDSQPHRKTLQQKGIRTSIARRRTALGSGLGVTRWVVERTIAWAHRFRRLNIRYERLAYMHEAFLTIGCIMICWNFLCV
jgi:transposase